MEDFSTRNVPGGPSTDMEKKQKINAKKFVEDFRAGHSDLELMHAHELSPANLEKVIKALVDKNLLDRAEVARRKGETEPDDQPSPYPEPLDWASHSAEMRRLHEEQGARLSFCPQCGAKISKKMLTCPECGHVIPGQERWADAEPKMGFLNRLSPKTIGIVIALPVAVGLFFFFKNIILPMAETVGEKRAQAVRKELPKGKTPMEAAKDLAKSLSTKDIQGEVQRYVDDEILSGARHDYSSFTVGPRWDRLTAQEKEIFVKDLSLTLDGAGLKKNFRLVGSGGQTIAKVDNGIASWRDGTELVLPQAAPPTAREQSPPDLEQPENRIQRALERLPAGGNAIRNLPGR